MPYNSTNLRKNLQKGSIPSELFSKDTSFYYEDLRTSIELCAVQHTSEKIYFLLYILPSLGFQLATFKKLPECNNEGSEDNLSTCIVEGKTRATFICVAIRGDARTTRSYEKVSGPNFNPCPLGKTAGELRVSIKSRFNVGGTKFFVHEQPAPKKPVHGQAKFISIHLMIYFNFYLDFVKHWFLVFYKIFGKNTLLMSKSLNELNHEERNKTDCPGFRGPQPAHYKERQKG